MDRLLALLLGLRYRQVVTVKRVRKIIFLYWLKSSVVGVLYVWDMTAYFISSAVLVMLEVVISTYSYARIFCTIRLQQTQVQDTVGSQRASMSPNIARYKKQLSMHWRSPNTGNMLSSFRRNNDCIGCSGIESVSFSGRGYGSKFSLPQFHAESCSLLLED